MPRQTVMFQAHELRLVFGASKPVMSTLTFTKCLISPARNKYLSHSELAQRLGGDELDAVTRWLVRNRRSADDHLITLAMDRYTHLGIVDLSAALERLPQIDAKPEALEAVANVATGTDGPVQTGPEKAPTVVPSGEEMGAERAAPPQLRIAPDCTEGRRLAGQETKKPRHRKPATG